MTTYIVKAISNNPNKFKKFKTKVKNILNGYFSDILNFPKGLFKGGLSDNFSLNLHSNLVDFKNLKTNTINDDFIKFLYQASLLYEGNKVLIDVGVNYGLFSLSLANYFSKIYAFEASKVLFQKLKYSKNLNNNMNIQLFNKAVTNTVGQIISFDSDFANGGAKITSENYLCKKTEKVETTSIDNEVKDTYDGLFFKIDVEGAEYLVMKGFEQCIERHKNKKLFGIIEFNNSHLSNDFGIDPYEFFNYLKEKFYILASFPNSSYFYDMRGFNYTDLLHSYYMYRPAGPNLHLNFLVSNNEDIYLIAKKCRPIKKLVIDKSNLLEKKISK